MTDLQTLTIRDFEKLVDSAFEVRSAQAGLQLSLVEVKAMGSGEREGGAFCQRRRKIRPMGGVKVGHLRRTHESAGRA